MPQLPITKIRLKITYLKFYWNSPGANEFICLEYEVYMQMYCINPQELIKTHKKLWYAYFMCIYYIDIGGLVQDCRISSVLTMEILQSCTKPPICSYCPQPMEFGGHRNRLVCCFVCLFMQCSNLSHFSGFRIFLEKNLLDTFILRFSRHD